MDFGIADTLNRRDVTLLAARLDAIDITLARDCDDVPWYRSSIADTLMNEAPGTRGDRAWLFASLIANIPGKHFDGEPADGDWDNLFTHIRAAILDRRGGAPSGSGVSAPPVALPCS